MLAGVPMDTVSVKTLPILQFAEAASSEPQTLTNGNQAAKDSSSSPARNERFKRLIEGVHFSKKLILTYQIVLIGLLLCFTILHWATRFRTWRRRKALSSRTDTQQGMEYIKDCTTDHKGTIVHSRSTGSSSSNSSLEADDVGISCDEHSPLLSGRVPPQENRNIWFLYCKIKAWLVYQPQPIPVVNKHLPSNGATLAILMFLGLQIFYTIFKIDFSMSMLFVFADRTSLLFVANLPLLYLFAAKNQPIKFLTGYSYDPSTSSIDDLGRMVGVWYIILRPVGLSLVQFIFKKMILLGIGAFISYELLYFTSLGSFRKRWYELFLASHVILQAAALVLVWLHHSQSRAYVGTALAMFLIDRVIYRMLIRYTTVRAELKLKDDKSTVTLRALLPIHKHSGFWRGFVGATRVDNGWKATEHIFLTVPALARKHVIQAHPFTIASKAPCLDQENADLELLIRAQTGFSADLVRYAQSHNTVSIRLDGPYGSQSAFDLLQGSDHAVIVAGGSGIAVAWPLICSLIEAPGYDIENTFQSRRRRDVLFVWIVRESSHISWLDDQKLIKLEKSGAKMVVPPATAEAGHPDIEEIVANWVNALAKQRASPDFGVVASGPEGLNRAVRNTCATLIKQGRHVNIEVEKFGW